MTDNRIHVAKYDASAHGKAVRKAWLKSDAGKASSRARTERLWRKKFGVDELEARIAELQAQLDSGWALCAVAPPTDTADWSRCWTHAAAKNPPRNRAAVYLDAQNGRYYATDKEDRQCGSYEALAEAQRGALAGYPAWKAGLRAGGA